MIISTKRAFVFVHIPKTGGTSMALALEDRAAADDILIGDTPKARRRRARLRALSPHGRLWKHSTLADIDGLLDAGTLAQMFTFTVVRNPWDRVVSYYHWARAQSFAHPVVAAARRLDFAGFLHDAQVQAGLRDTPASYYMRSADGVERCNLYIRLEHLNTDARPLWDHLGFEAELPHANPSLRPPDYRAAFDDRCRNIVAVLCAEDIARFGYSFD